MDQMIETYDVDFHDELQNGLVEAINRWYENNEMRIVIVEGYQGVGKSLYSLLIASEVYKTKSWSKLQNFYAYRRDEFLQRCNNKLKRHPLVIWDDAGNWLHTQDYRLKEVVAVCKYFQVARPDWGCIMLTCVDAEDIVSRIRNMNNRILVQIIKNSNKVQPDRRIARIYTRWKSPDKTKKGERNRIDEEFYLHYCDPKLYSPYEIYRNSFVKQAKKEIAEANKMKD
jgi:hypothetical protein